MAAPTTLVDLATQEVATATAAQSAAQNALRLAQGELASATDEATTLTKSMAQLAKDEKDEFTAYDAATTDADRQAATDNIAALEKQRRALEHQLIASAVRVETARRAVSARQADVTRSASDLIDTNADVKRQTMRDLGQAPPASLAADATAALASQTYKDAEQRIATDIPAPLLGLARARAANQTSRSAGLMDSVADARGALASAQATFGGAAGAAAQKQATYDAAVANLLSEERKGQADLAVASGLLAGITSAPPLSAEAIQAQKDAVASDDAVTHATAVETAQGAVDAAQAALDLALATAIAADPDTVEANQGVIDARKALDDKNKDLGDAQQAYTTAESDAIDGWDATIPDSSWRLLADFDTATTTLNGLANPKFTTLRDAVTTAEADLVKARLGGQKAERAVAQLESIARERSDLADASAPSTAAQYFSALRGDG